MDTLVNDESSCVANSMALGLDGFDNVISCAPVIKRIHTYINGLWNLKLPGGYRDTEVCRFMTFEFASKIGEFVIKICIK